VAKTTSCLLCGIALEPLPDGLQQHPEVVDCDVRLTDAWGVAVEVSEEPAEAEASAEPESEPGVINLQIYHLVEDVLAGIFTHEGLRRLGGVSSGRGWSSVSTFQRCPHAWNLKYRVQRKPWLVVESPSLAIGTLIHTFLAVHYQLMIEPKYPLTPEIIYDVTKRFANPEFVEEAWRVFIAYRVYYSIEVIQPLAVEYDLRDPRTGESCRFDLIAYFPEGVLGDSAGTFVCEHKSASRFDDDTLYGWINDGEILGQVALWKRLGLDLRFGPLKGVIVNILGKHKEPQFHRTLVAPETWQIEGHLDDLKRWEGLIQLGISSNSFPRARNGCIGRYGRCAFFDECATGEH
jgi:hypothetical protein